MPIDHRFLLILGHEFVLQLRHLGESLGGIRQTACLLKGRILLCHPLYCCRTFWDGRLGHRTIGVVRYRLDDLHAYPDDGTHHGDWEEEACHVLLTR